MKPFLSFLFLFSIASASAQSQAPTPTTLITAARLLDVRSGKVINRAGVLVQGDKILQVGPIVNVEGKAMPQTTRVELGDATLLPGLIDCHTHILGNLKDFSAVGALRMSSAEQAIWGVRNIREWLDRGFTMLRDAGEIDSHYAQFALRDGVNRGDILGPRIVAAGSLVSQTGGHGDANFFASDQPLPRRPNLSDTPEEMAQVVRRDLKYGADWIKLMTSGGILDPFSDYNKQELSQQQMETAVEIAHRAGRKVMVHAEGAAGIKPAVRAGVDSVEHGTVLDEEAAALMEQRGTWLVPTLWTFQFGAQLGEKIGLEPVMLKKVRAIVKEQDAAFRLAMKHHLKIAFGSDLYPEEVPHEFDALVRGGLQPVDAIRSATSNAAQLLGWEDRVGYLETGKLADVVAVEGDPLTDIKRMERVVFVMKEGKVYKDARSGGQ